MIKEILSESELLESVKVIKLSFETVAAEFGLTLENCPAHPAFITYEKLVELKNNGVKFFGLHAHDRQVGFVAIEKFNDNLYYIERLAVLPSYRHNSFGEKLIKFAVDHIKNDDGKIVSIGIIDDHAILKQWYKSMGFSETQKKRFNHLPFMVCFMEYRI